MSPPTQKCHDAQAEQQRIVEAAKEAEERYAQAIAEKMAGAIEDDEFEAIERDWKVKCQEAEAAQARIKVLRDAAVQLEEQTKAPAQQARHFAAAVIDAKYRVACEEIEKVGQEYVAALRVAAELFTRAASLARALEPLCDPVARRPAPLGPGWLNCEVSGPGLNLPAFDQRRIQVSEEDVRRALQAAIEQFKTLGVVL